MYKVVDLASKLTQVGALVDVIMTDAAQQFVTPLTFQSVTGRPVYTSMWQNDQSGGLPTHIAHVGLGEGAHLLAVVPATANTLAKLAAGMADDLLTVTALAARCPLLVAPVMDGGMYEHAATQASIDTLVKRGAYLVEPDDGRFASGLVGKGRLPDTPTLIGHIRQVLAQAGSLNGYRVVISAGATREPLDPVRYITNRSSGKQGYALAQAALDAGAAVTLVSTMDHLPVPVGARWVLVDTAQALHDAILEAVQGADALIMAAAVADFRPATIAEQKIKKQDQENGLSLSLSPNPDILMAVKSQREQTGFPRRTIGFAAESENLLTNAQSKLVRKGLDLLIANDISARDAGFAVDTNRVSLLYPDGKQQSLNLMSKAQVAEHVINTVVDLLKQH